MNCNKCEFAARIKDAENGTLRYEDTPCATCELTEDSSRTLEYVEGQASGPIRWPPPEEAENGAEHMPVAVLATALHELLHLPADTLRVLRERYLGRSFAEIGQETGTTPQAAEIKVRRLLQRHEVLRALLPSKAKKMATRKRLRRSAARRGKPGAGLTKEGGAGIG